MTQSFHTQFHTYPRLYTSQPLRAGQSILLTEDQSHYVKNVLRQGDGSFIRVFQEQDGEWVAGVTVQGKRLLAATPQTQIRVPERSQPDIHLFFSPIKKDRQDMLIEKAVELGVTHLHPVLFARTIVREVKVDRIRAQMMEAAEQCERLDIPVLYPLVDLKKAVRDSVGPLFVAMERQETLETLSAIPKTFPCGFMVGPEGGIAPEERDYLLQCDGVRPVSLGPRILRAETAVFYGLSLLSS